MDMQPNLGKTPSYRERDAVHVAVIPVEAGHLLHPGARVGLNAEGKAVDDEHEIGIVDPFLSKHVKRGELFWLCLFPDTVTGMRHHWSHPAFSDGSTEKLSEYKRSAAWLQWFAGRIDWAYDEMIDHVSEFCKGNMPMLNESDSQRAIAPFLENEEDFWKHFKIVTGLESNKTPFHCRC